MDPIVVFALLSAAVLHSSWHAMVKVSGDKMVSLAGMNVVSTLAGLVLLPFVPLPPPVVLAVLAGSVVLHNGYKLALARLYQLGDLSVGYPVARGMAPVFAALMALVLLGEVPGPGQLVGIVLVSAGLVCLATGQGRPSAAALAVALVASLSVAGYSVVDAWGVRLAGDWLGFTSWLLVLDGASFVFLTNWLRRGQLWRALALAPGRTLTTGLLGIASFAVFVWALGASHVGGVSALRETSVVFAALIGVVVLKERLSLQRGLGIGLVAAGVISLAFR